MNFRSDIDIDFGNRDKLLSLIEHTRASMRNVTPIRHHATGVYITDIPYDPVHDMATLNYTDAEKRGYFKLDLLNVHVYEKIKANTIAQVRGTVQADILKEDQAQNTCIFSIEFAIRCF